MSHLNPSTPTIRKSALTFMVVGLSVLSAATLAGQGPFAPASGPLDLILQKLDALQAAVASLAPGPEPSEVTLRTSPVSVRLEVDTFVDCNVANVSASTIGVKITQLDQAGAVVTTQTVSVAAGRAVSSGHNADQGMRRCEFTFTGFVDDVRANMTARDNQIENPLVPPSAVFEAR